MEIKTKFFDPFSYYPNLLEKSCTLQDFTKYWKNRVQKPPEQAHSEPISIHLQINATFAVLFMYRPGLITLLYMKYTCNTNILGKPCMRGFTIYWKTRVLKPHKKIPLESISTLVHTNTSHVVLFKYNTEKSLFYMEMIYKHIAQNYLLIISML